MRPLRYFFGYIFPAIAVLTLQLKGLSLITLPIVAFVLIPVLEIALRGTEENVDIEEIKEKRWAYDALIYGVVPLQVGVFAYLLYLSGQGHFSGFEWAGAIFTVGICSGTFGINVAHELGHRKSWYEQRMAQVLLLTCLYMHFFIEHNRGHHARVATEEDAASSRKGEWLYTFWFRSVTKSWTSAWELEVHRLRKEKSKYFTFKNQMFCFQLVQLATLLMVGALTGIAGVLTFIGSASVGFLLLETVNYIEHYGLSREKNSKGRYEKVRPHHSWNSNHSIGRVLLFELTRHSDHHAHPSRAYAELRYFERSPQLPSGYPAMVLLALFPPLWFKIMDNHLEQELERLAQIASSSAA